MSYCEDYYAYNDDKDINLNSQFEYALSIGIMIDNNYHCSFTSLLEDLDQLNRNIIRLVSDKDIMEKISSSKSKSHLLSCILDISILGTNWCEELTEDPGNDLEKLRALVSDILNQATARFGMYNDALSNIRKDNIILRKQLAGGNINGTL